MDWMNQIGNLLQKYAGGQPSEDEARQDFDNVSSAAPKPSLASAIASAFRSDQTPPFSNMVGQLFQNGSGEQRAGMLNHLFSLAPGLIAGNLGGLLGGLGSKQQITPEQAQQVPPEEVERLAAEAERKDPSIVERMSDFYADNPGLVKALGAGALAIAIRSLTQRRAGG